MIQNDNTALRYDNDKARIDLIPPECITALGDHFTKGAKKYKERNWQSGMDWTKCYNSMMRHALAWMGGEDIDPENKSHHLIAVAWNALALYWYWLKKVGKDTRPKYTAKQPTQPSPPPSYGQYKSSLKEQIDEHIEEIECCGKKY